MGEIQKYLYNNWPDGANTSIESDELPATAYPSGRNICLRSISDGKAIISKRKGCTTLNATPVTGATAVIGQHEFRKLSGGVFTSYHLLVSDSGRLDKVDTSGTLTAINASAFTSSTSQEHLPAFADANNLCFIVNGIEAKKYDGTSLTTFGIVEPSTAPTLAAGAAGSHNGTYEARVTYYNSLTGHESSAGPTSTTLAVVNQKISWTNIPVSADAQVNARRLYIRNVATQANFYFVTEIADNTTTTFTSDLLDSSLTVIGPDRSSNDPPPSGIKYLAWHKSRMFAANDTEVFFSAIKDPESFDPDNTEPVNPTDSQKITGLTTAFDALIIFKSSSMYIIVGDDPTTWAVQSIDPTIGCIAHRSIIFAGNALYWWSLQGPVKWDGTGSPTLLAPNKMARSMSSESLSSVQIDMAKICGIEDINEHRVLWAVPELNKARNTIIFPYSYRLDQWESTGWDPMDVASFALVLDSIGKAFVMLGGYSGQVFKFWNGDHDGLDITTTYQGTFTAFTTSIGAISDGSANFLTTGGGLVERKVTIVDSYGLPVDNVRPYITSNNSTVIAFSNNVQGLTVGQTYTYYIGGPALYFTSSWLNQGDPFSKKRYMHCFISLRPTTSAVHILLDLQTDYQIISAGFIPQVISAAGGGLWDSSLWDASLWDGFESATDRFRVGLTGRAIQLRIQHYVPNTGLDIQKFGLTAEFLTEYIG